MKFTVIPHVHWDREWYFTQQKSTLYLLHDMDEVLDQLDGNPEITYFLFDAQTSLIEDYLMYHPEREEQLKRLVKDHRLLTGPWYTQTDQMVIHGESIVRNLLYGTREANAFGNCFLVGYAVDCFGQAAQMPQIYKGFQIPYTIFKRGIETSKIPYTEFMWKSDDGSEVFAYHCIDYMNFRNPSNVMEENKALVESIGKKYEKRSLSKEVFLFNGFDQHPIRNDLADIIRGLKINEDSSVGLDYMENVFERIINNQELPNYTGELTCGETSRIHKSIYSSRADLKQANARCENKLIRIIEPLQAIYYELTKKDERLFIKNIWKLMMKNAAHDSIGCCNSDFVNRQISQRFDEVMDSLTEYENLTYRLIANQIKQNLFSIQAYNFLPYERKEEITAKILTPFKKVALKSTKGSVYQMKTEHRKDVTQKIKGALEFGRGIDGSYEKSWDEYETIYECDITGFLTLPAMGYETFDVIESDEESFSQKELENDFIKISINNNGSLTVFDKRTMHEYTKMLMFEDGADAGDSYDYSSSVYDRLITSEKAVISSLKIEGSKASYELELDLPFDLQGRKEGLFDKRLLISVTLHLVADKPEIRFLVKVTNTSTEHRLRVRFSTDIKSEYSYADQTFGVIKRPVYLPSVKDWKEKNWDEKPRCIEPMQSYVYLEGEGRKVGLITDGVKEYEIIGENFDTIAYTLFRSFPKMGKTDLDDRPGRASGKEWDTPDAMLLKTMEFEFSLCIPSIRKPMADCANETLTPIRIHQEIAKKGSFDEFLLGDRKKQLPAGYSSFSMDHNKTQFSIYKLGEDRGTIVRACQLEKGPMNVISEGKRWECQLDETNDQDYDSSKEYKKNQIITIRMER